MPDERFAMHRSEHDDHHSDGGEPGQQAAGDAESGQQLHDADEQDDRLRQPEVFRPSLGIADVAEAAPDEDQADEDAQGENRVLVEYEHD
jgi:hypothetical protein